MKSFAVAILMAAVAAAVFLPPTDARAQAGRPPSLQPGGASKSREAVAGTWTFETKGTKGEGMKQMTGVTILQFLAEEQDKKAITGTVFGREIAESEIDSAQPGGRIQFKTTIQHESKRYRITWRGKLNKDGNEITDGEFSLTTGEGTFTAKKP